MRGQNRARELDSGQEGLLLEVRSMNDSLQRQLNTMEELKETAEDKARQQEKQIHDLHDQLQEDANRLQTSRVYLEQVTEEYNKVAVELETLKSQGGNSDQLVAAERDRYAQELLGERDRNA